MNKIKDSLGKSVDKAVVYGKKTANRASDYAVKYRIKLKLKKQHKFTQDELDEVFRIWKGDMKGLKQKIKDTEAASEEVCEYTQMSTEMGKLLYDALLNK